MMSLGDCTLWVQWEHWLPVPVPKEDTVRTVRGLYPAACRLLSVVALFVGDCKVQHTEMGSLVSGLASSWGPGFQGEIACTLYLGHAQWA